MSVLLDRVGQRPNDRLALGIGLHATQVFAQGLARHGQQTAVHQAFLDQQLHQRRRAADGDQVRHHVPPAGFQVRQHRRARAHAVEVVEIQLHVRGMGDPQQMQHRVGRTAHGHDQGDGVQERLAREDVGGPDAAPDQVQHRPAGLAAVARLRRGHGVLRAAVRQAHAQRLDRGGHGVGRVHPAARAGAWNGAGFDLAPLAVGDLPACLPAHGFEHADDVHLLAAVAAGLDRAAVDEHGGPVEPRHRDQATRHVLVAAADGHQAVERLAAGHGLDRIRDDLARHEGIAHARRTHRYPVGNRDRVEDHRLASGGRHAFRRPPRQPVDVHVAGRDLAPGRGDADLRLPEIGAGEADRVQHGAAGRAFHAVRDRLRPVAFQRGFPGGFAGFLHGLAPFPFPRSLLRRSARRNWEPPPGAGPMQGNGGRQNPGRNRMLFLGYLDILSEKWLFGSAWILGF